jgi:hypothetical protein
LFRRRRVGNNLPSRMAQVSQALNDLFRFAPHRGQTTSMYFNMANSLQAGFEPAFTPITGLSYQLEDREFLRLITPQHGVYPSID